MAASMSRATRRSICNCAASSTPTASGSPPSRGPAVEPHDNKSALRSILADDLFDLGAEAGGDVLARQRVGDVGGEEADLGAAVETAALEFQAVEILRARERDHRVGQLNLAAGAAVLFRQQIENLRLQDVAAGDDEVRWRALARRVLHHGGDREYLALLFADADD